MPPRRTAVLVASVALGVASFALPASGTVGADVVVAFLDSGVLASHQEFAPGQLVAWRDFVTPGNLLPIDPIGHGTAVASVAVGLTKGESPGTKFMMGRVCATTSCDLALVAQGITWAVNQGADVVSISIGTIVPAPHLVFQLTGAGVDGAILYARNNGVLVVVAAGNGIGNAGLVPYPSETGQPSGSHNALVVGGAAEGGAQTLGSLGFSSDPEATQAALSVPAASNTDPAGYVLVSGTSFAAPNVAGIAAEVQKAWRAQYGSPIAPVDLENILKWTTVDTLAPPDLEGYGYVSKAAALGQVPLGLPGQPCATLPPLPPDTSRCASYAYVELGTNTVRQVW